MALIGKAASVLALKATLTVNTKPGASVTITKGGVTVATLTANASGNCSLEILAANFGTYTASAVYGTASGSASIAVSDVTSYTLRVNMVMYLIQSGNFSSGFSHALSAGSNVGCGFYDEGDAILLHTKTDNHSWQRCAGYFSAINFNDGFWKNIIIDWKASGDPARVGLVSGTPSNDPSYSTYMNLNSRNTSDTARTTSTLSINGQTGTQCVTLRAAAWTDEDIYGNVHGWTAGRLRVYNLYLRSY